MLARLPARTSARASATATGSTARATRRTGMRCNPAKLLLDPYAKAIEGEVELGPGRVRLPLRRPRRRPNDDRQRAVRAQVRGRQPVLRLGRRPAAPHAAGTRRVIYEVHVKGFTSRHPDIARGAARHLRRPGPPRRHRAPPARSASPPSSCMPVHQFVHDAPPGRAGPAQLLGLQLDRLLRPAQRLRRAAASGASRCSEFKPMVQGAARGRHRGDPRRGLQPHRRGQPPRARRCRFKGIDNAGLLPAGARRPALLHGLHGHRQHASTCATRTCCS